MSYHFDSNDRDDSGLERCPFCQSKDIFLWFSPDGEAEYYTHKGKVSRTPVLYVVKCNQCGARTANFADLNDALKAWNRREGGQDDAYRKRCCCNCRRNIRTGDPGKIVCHCEIDGHYISYVACFVGWCRRWARETKWDKDGGKDDV